MEERSFNAIRQLPRDELEAFALKAAAHLRRSQQEIESSRFFVAVLTSFLIGALVASSGFLFGAALG